MIEVTDGSFFFAKIRCLEFESGMFLRYSEHSAILPVRASCLVRLVLLAYDAREFAWEIYTLPSKTIKYFFVIGDDTNAMS